MHGSTMMRNNWILQRVNGSRPGTPKGKSPHSSSFFSSSNSSLGSRSSSLGRDLLDLPLEIRLLIYEAVFPPASVALQSGKNPGMIVKLQNYPDLISRGSRDVQLFRTCRAIYEEAAPIFYSSLHVLVYQHLALLRFDFLPRIGAYNASFIKRAIITPIGLPGEHHRFLECLGVKHGGLVGLENLTIELWNLDHVSAFVNTCQELMHHHGKLKILFGRGIDSEGQLHPGDIPARLKLAKRGQLPACREHTIDSVTALESSTPLPMSTREKCRDILSDEGPLTSRGRRQVSLSLPKPRRTIWAKSRNKFRRSDQTRL